MAYGLFIIAIICSLQVADAASTKKDYVPIKYPGPIQDLSNRYATEEDKLPDVCKGKGYCTVKPKDYPQEQFNALFKGTKLAPPPNLVIETFGDRQGDPDDADGCESEISYEPLYEVRGTDGKLYTVIQAPEQNFVQKVRLESCKEIDSPCFQRAALAPNVVTFCKQMYSIWKLVVSDGNNGTETIKAQLPICCSCHYKMDARK